MIFRTSMGIAAMIAVATTLASQPRPGDFVACDKRPLGHVITVDRTTGALSTIVAGPVSGNRAVLGLTMADDNTDMFLLEEGGPGFYLWRITPGGVVTTLGAASTVGEGAPTACELLQDGNLIVTSAVYQSRDYLRTYDLTQQTYTSLHLHTPSNEYFYEARQNPDTGNLIVCATIGRKLFEYDMVANTLSTLLTGIGTNSADVDPFTGNYVVGGSGLRIVSPQGSILNTLSTSMTRRIQIESETGNIVGVTGSSSSSVDRIVEYDAAGNVIRTYGPYAGYNFTGLDIYGRRKVTGRGTARPGSTHGVQFSFQGRAGWSYFAALSFSRRPGIVLNGATLHLAPDALLLASLQGLFVANFQGRLSAVGRANGAVLLPGFMPPGITIFCSALATDGITIDVGNAIGITVR